MLSPGSLTNSVPDPDKAVRRQRDTERIAQENISSVAQSFQTTIDTLTAQVAQIAALQATAVTPVVSSASGTAVWGTGYATFASFNFTVPAGCTRAAIVASGGSATFSNAGSDDYRMRVLINGAAGGESRSIQTAWNFVSAFSAANLTGLTAGAAISVALQGHLTTGPGGTAGTAVLTGIALFLP